MAYENGEWVDHDPLNPCRVPPGYRLLDLLEPTQPGDIYWHNVDTKWRALGDFATGTTPYIFNFPVARKINAESDNICR